MSEHKIRPDLEERAPDLIALQTHSNVVTVTGLESRQARSDWVHFCDLFKPQADYPDARNNGITDYLCKNYLIPAQFGKIRQDAGKIYLYQSFAWKLLYDHSQQISDYTLQKTCRYARSTKWQTSMFF